MKANRLKITKLNLFQISSIDFYKIALLNLFINPCIVVIAVDYTIKVNNH